MQLRARGSSEAVSGPYAAPGTSDFAGEPVRARRAVLICLVIGVTALLVWQGAAVLRPGGWSICKIMLFACLCVNAPWLGLSAATGLIGFAIRLLVADPVAYVLPQLARAAQGRPALRTAIAVCVRDEDVAAVFGQLTAIARSVCALDMAGRFVFCVLSDSASDTCAEAEMLAAHALRTQFGVEVFYRRRAENVGFKAGNVMSFLDAHEGQFELMLCLDADSEMAVPTILRMVAVMEADPRLAILQATFHGAPAAAVFARLFGFGHRFGLRIWAVGQAWWQADQGPYWGHNAVLRVAPFRAHCRLDALPGGQLILSHDHVEAARLQAAGWKLRVLADDTGSLESHPPGLAAYLARDVRWAAGNLQYRYLLRRRDLGPLGRFQMLQAILHYVLTPFWFATLPLAAANAALGDAQAVPRAGLVWLLLGGWLTLHLPKLAGYLEVLLRPSLAAVYGGYARFLRRAAAELVYTALLDPIIALHKAWAVLRLAAGLRAEWGVQVRDAQRLGWAAAARMFWPHTVAGLAIWACLASASVFAGSLGAVFCAGLVLAVPFAVFTSRFVPSEEESK